MFDANQTMRDLASINRVWRLFVCGFTQAGTLREGQVDDLGYYPQRNALAHPPIETAAIDDVALSAAAAKLRQ